VRYARALQFVTGVAAPPAAQTPPPQPQPPQGKPDPSIRDGSAQRALDRARRRWRRAGVHNYRFRITRSCFCPPSDDPVIFVRDDRPLNATSSTRHVATVPRLHRRVQEAIDDEVDGLEVRYDKRGIPREIGIDRFRMAADDEVSYSVERFWRGTTGRGGPERPPASG
jgi:hypothetical protein